MEGGVVGGEDEGVEEEGVEVGGIGGEDERRRGGCRRRPELVIMGGRGSGLPRPPLMAKLCLHGNRKYLLGFVSFVGIKLMANNIF